jgi:hypothetical protein
MAITNGYCTLAELRGRLGLLDADTTDDTKLESIVEAVSRLIDNWTARHFYQTSAGTVKYFTANEHDILFIPDITTLTALATDETGERTYPTAWATTDYDLEPFNAAGESKPYTYITLPPQGRYTFPEGVGRGVKITGTWGWPSVPLPIKEACLLQSARLFKRKDSIFGVVGSSELGQMMQITRLDPDVQMLVDPYRRIELLAI